MQDPSAIDSLLTEDDRLLIEAVRDFARAELPERDAEWDRTEGSCCSELPRLAEIGLMGLRVPEQFGGLDCRMVPYAHIIRELAACSASVAVMLSVHNMVAEIVNRYACDEVRAEVLPRLAAPRDLAAFAISEPNAGSDPSSATTRAEKVDGGWRLTGSKMWVSNGISGKWFVALARHADDDILSMFLVNAEKPGVERRHIHGKMGIRGSETAEMNLDGVFIPDAYLLGEPGWGLRIALSALDGGRIGIASQAAGIAQACLDLMTGYASQREQFGKPIANFQAIQWMLADTKTELLAAQALIDQAAWRKQQDLPFGQQAAMAKLYATEAANRIAYRAVQTHGGYGYVKEFRVEQLYRDARVTTIYEGTSEIQRIVIARGLQNTDT